ncbi:MAG: VOC family protein [Hyphomicrobiaceae bacterium]|nr:VOC family protein [Hyphomicrobiaceae bacterium]
MSMRSIIGLDHVVVMTRDLAEGARRWASLGFTVSPRGMHTAVMGTANHTIMLGHDYLELIGVIAETERNAPGRAFLARRGEGIERAAFTGTDADEGVAELKARGFAALGPYDFGRPVDMPDRRKVEARFRTFVWPVEERPGGLRVFACQHLTRENVWIPELTRHANTATRIDRVEMLSPDPVAAAAHMGRLIDRTPERLADSALRVETGSGRGDFVFLDRATLERRHPGVPLAGIPDEGAITIALTVTDGMAAANAVGAKACVVTPKIVKVAPAEANGVLLELAEIHP